MKVCFVCGIEVPHENVKKENKGIVETCKCPECSDRKPNRMEGEFFSISKRVSSVAKSGRAAS